MAVVKIWKVIWYATQDSDPMAYYFKEDRNIEPTFSGWTPPPPTSFYTKEQFEVESTSWEYKLCLD